MLTTNPAARTNLVGAAYGLAAVLIWALYLSTTRQAVSGELTPADVIFFRFAGAGLIMLPWLMRNGVGKGGLRDLGGVGWLRGAALALAVGPVFIFVASAAFVYVPLAHGAVLQPSTAAMASIAAAIFLLHERVTKARMVGTAIIIGGITLIATGSGGRLGEDAWIGYALSVAAGLCWAIFTVMLKQWSIDGIDATAAASFISALVYVPLFFAFDTTERMAQLSLWELSAQFLVHGALAGVMAIIAFGRAVTHLGASGASLFPALVPASTLIVGIPITGEWPSLIEWIGALTATLGLAVAVGAFSRHTLGRVRQS